MRKLIAILLLLIPTLCFAEYTAVIDEDLDYYEETSALAPKSADYLVGTSNAGLSAEIVVGTTPNGDLGGTWDNISVDDDSHAHTGSTLSGIDISADTNLTAGDALTLTDDDLDFDGGASPGGELGGTWASPTIDDLFLLNSGDTGTGAYLFQSATPQLTLGKDEASLTPNIVGQLKLFSAGDNAYYSTLTAGTNTSNAAYILPVDEPAGTYLLNMTTGGQIGYDASAYLTTEVDGSITNELPIAGNYIDISGSPASTVDVDLTEAESVTWGAGGAATIVHTYNVSGTDTTMTMGSAATTFSGGLTVTGSALSVDANTINLSDTTDEYILAFDTGTQTWRGVAAGAASGDITSVGDVATGAAFDGTQGTTLTFNNAGGDATLAYDGTDFDISKPITVAGAVTGSSLSAGTGTVTGGIITASTQLISDKANDTAATCALIDFRKARDGTPTDDVSDNDYLGELRFRGYKTDGYYEGAIIRAVVNGTPGSGDMPTELIFATSADGSATPTTRLTIDATGMATFANGITGALTGNADTSTTCSGNAGTVTNGVYTTGNQSIAGIKTFSDATEASNTTTGGTVISGGLAVAKRVYATDMTVTNKITGSISGTADGNALLASSISDADTTHAPDGNSVFDALALKSPLNAPTFTGTVAIPDINLTGGQIAFPASQAASGGANTLDDYEEGSWTPVMTFGGASVGVTYSAQTGYYTKIGRQVTCIGSIILTSNGSSTGFAAIDGLPFAAANARSVPSLSIFNGISFANQYSGILYVGNTFWYLMEITEAGVQTTIDNTNVADDAHIGFSITYFI